LVVKPGIFTWFVLDRPVEVLVEPYGRIQRQQQQIDTLTAPLTPQCTSSTPAGDVVKEGSEQQQQQQESKQEPVLAVVFTSPPARCIKEGLPPLQR
jgi:hypothetical protein